MRRNNLYCRSVLRTSRVVLNFKIPRYEQAYSDWRSFLAGYHNKHRFLRQQSLRHRLRQLVIYELDAWIYRNMLSVSMELTWSTF